MNPKFGRLTDRKKGRMLVIFRPDPVRNPLRSQHILLAEMSEPPEGRPSTVLQKLKLGVARKLRKRSRPVCAGQMRLPFAETGAPLRAFWQARFYDFHVYSQGKKRGKLEYMHANPVIRCLVKHPRDWRWSSWGFYRGGAAGLVAIDVEE